MIEWFHDRLRAQGHHPVQFFTGGRLHYRNADRVLLRLSRHDLKHPLVFPYWEAKSTSQEMMERLLDAKFKEWTSFQFEKNVYFVFSRIRDAVEFRLMWA
jgi:hypothetical protein